MVPPSVLPEFARLKKMVLRDKGWLTVNQVVVSNMFYPQKYSP